MENLPEKKSFDYYFQVTDEGDDGLTKWLKSISFLSALIALLIFADYFLPLKENTHKVQNLIVRSGFSNMEYEKFLRLKYKSGEEEFWVMLDGEEFAVTEDVLSKQKINDEIIIFKTTLFGINMKFQNKTDSDSRFFYPYFDVYGLLIIIPIIFLVFFFVMRLFSDKSEVVLSIGVLNIFLLVGFGVLLLFY
jgi:hypothetical protein